MAAVNGIRQFDRVRKYLEKIYLYGFFGREDFKRLGLGSAKDYDYAISLIKELFPEIDDGAFWKDRKKFPRVMRQYVESANNKMADAYSLCSSDTEEICLTAAILASLANSGKGLADLSSAVPQGDDTETDKYNTLRRRVIALTEAGYVNKSRRTFELAGNILAKLSDGELKRLWSLITLEKGVSFPRVAGSFLVSSIERTMVSRGLEPPEQIPFLLRSNVNRNVFDEDLVYTLLESIAERKDVELTTARGSFTVTPSSLRVDARLGRWYLIFGGDEMPGIIKLSSIRKAEPVDVMDQAGREKKAAAAEAAFRSSGVSGKRGEPVRLEFRLNFGERSDVRSLFLRRKSLGRVYTRDGSEFYEAELSDPIELVPFLREFSPWLSVTNDGGGLRDYLLNSLTEMKRNLAETDGGTYAADE